MTVPETDADSWIATNRAAHDRVAALATQLDDSQLTGPSGCSEWDVAQVLGHLGSGAEIALATLEAARNGVPAPGPDTNPTVWARWDALGPEAKRDGFLEHGERLAAALDSLTAEERDSVRVEVFYLPEPIDVGRFASFRLSEVALHGWDVEVQSTADAVIDDAAAELLATRLPDLVGFFGKADVLSAPVDIRVELPGGGRAVGLTVADAVSIGDAPAADRANAVLRITDDAWLRLISGRLSPEHTPSSVTLDSSSVSLDDLRRVFPGY